MKISNKTALIVFAREPKLGKVKTRLQKDLPAKKVLQLYKAFVKDVLAVAERVCCSQRFLYYSGAPNSIDFLTRHGEGFILKRQTGKDLGKRMLRALKYCQKSGAEKVVIIGTDCLTLTAADIEYAFCKLEDHDAVIGPSEDGGYYLIGVKGSDPKRGLTPFGDIDWGTDRVLSQTLKNLKKEKKTYHLLPQKYDIDTIFELKRLSCYLNRNKKSSKTADFLKKYVI